MSVNHIPDAASTRIAVAGPEADTAERVKALIAARREIAKQLIFCDAHEIYDEQQLMAKKWEIEAAIGCLDGQLLRDQFGSWIDDECRLVHHPNIRHPECYICTALDAM